MELSSSGISADLSKVSSGPEQGAEGGGGDTADLFVSLPGQGHGIVGAVGAEDWAGGFLDLKADLQGDTFVGNVPLTPEVRAGYLGEYFSFLLGSFGCGEPESGSD